MHKKGLTVIPSKISSNKDNVQGRDPRYKRIDNRNLADLTFVAQGIAETKLESLGDVGNLIPRISNMNKQARGKAQRRPSPIASGCIIPLSTLVGSEAKTIPINPSSVNSQAKPSGTQHDPSSHKIK
ncbi:hypothetical protein V6N13_073822 [Hibiscus sabdariffa]|uniref:Uncharacterized protein n=1 Tax=Hibiscus sabdariffa TaxID=183260 RepID=A0ABR2BXZ8_9ROSI